MNVKLYLFLALFVITANQRAFAQCTPTVGFTGASGDYIENFTFATISNLGSGDNAADYALYPMTTSVIQGLSYPFTIQTGSPTWNQGLGMWIDFNGNGLFTDLGEFVYASPTSSNTSATILSGNITIPLTAVPGVRRLRVCAKYAQLVVSTESCGHATFGEYEDYNITIVANTPCSGTPTAGTSTASPANPCPGVSVNFGLTGNSLVGNLAYQWISSTTNSAPWTVIAGGNVLGYTALPPAGVTTYYRCIVTCTNVGGGSDTSVAVPVTVQSWSPTSPCYCNSAATSNSYEEILNVTLGTLNNTTTCGTPLTGTQGAATGVANQYANFTGSISAPVAYVGLAQPFSVTIGNCNGLNLGSAVKIYIDYNHNASFSDPGEEIYFSGLTAINSIPNAVLSGTFTPPVAALPGITRMRVINQVDGYLAAGSITPCNVYDYGETEDYLINILPPSPYDPAIISMTSPSGNCYSANQLITAQLRNYGSNTIDLSVNPVTVTLNVTGPTGIVPYVTTVSTGLLTPYGASGVTALFSNVNMYAGGTYYLNTTLTIAGVANGNLVNDSLPSPIVKINFRPTAGPNYPLCQYSAIPFGQGLSVSGCATPISDSVTINFTLSPTTNPTGASPTGSALFAKGVLPALPAGSSIGICDYTVTNLATALGGWALETRFPLFYGNTPPQAANIFYASIQGNGATSSPNYTWFNSNTALTTAVGNIYNTLTAGDTLKMGYHSTWGGNATSNGYTPNAQSLPTVATLKIRYTYVPASFEWYSAPAGGINLYSFSPFNPLVTTGSGLSNSNTTGTYTWFAACAGSSACRVPVSLVINPVPQVVQDTLALCESSVGSNSAVFDLTTMDGPVSAFAPNTTVEYYGDQGLFSQIIPANSVATSTNFVYSKVIVNATQCFSTDSLLLNVNFQPELITSNGFACAPAAIDVSTLINPLSTSPTGTDTLFFSDPGYSIPFPNPTNITAADTVYILFATSGTPVCSDSAEVIVDIIPANNYISGQVIGLNYSNPGSFGCMSTTLTDGNSDTIRSTVDCKRVAAITDIPNSISLGTISACLDITASTPFHNGQPYLNRSIQITAANSDTAQVCLYFLDQDFQDYNADASFFGWPLLPTAATMPTNMGNIAVTKVNNGDLNTPGHIPTPIGNNVINASYDPATTVWTVCFPVSGFSYYYLHTQNPGNIPLPVTMLQFNGRRSGEVSELRWSTATEQNNSHFVVERSRDGKSFSGLSAAIASKAPNGNSQIQLDYGFTDAAPYQGHNYYRLQQHDLDGNISYSQVVDLYFGNETMANLYPNPVSNLLNVSVTTPKATAAQLKITDATGRTVRVAELPLQAGYNSTQIDLQGLADGIYMVNITNGKGIQFSQPVRKH